jgi:hypothetical protein
MAAIMYLPSSGCEYFLSRTNSFFSFVSKCLDTRSFPSSLSNILDGFSSSSLSRSSISAADGTGPADPLSSIPSPPKKSSSSLNIPASSFFLVAATAKFDQELKHINELICKCIA